MKRPGSRKRWTVLFACLLAGAITDCTYYQAAPAPSSGPSVFDRSWNAALAAAEDVGVSVYMADRASGTIRGTTANDDVTIRVLTQADGSVRVEISAKGGPGSDPAVTQRLSDAYDRRMGR
jgi:hypothetical protein